MRFALTLVASIALVACGGSGSDDPDYGPPVGPGALTRSNYVPVAQAALTTNAYLLDATHLFMGVEVSDSAVLVKFAQDRLGQFLRRAAAPVQAVGVVEVMEERCDDGGKVVVEYTDANNNGRDDRGDFVIFKPYNCAYGGSVLNGQVKLTLEGTSGNPGAYPYSMSATALYSDLSATAAGVTTRGNGSMTFSVSEQSAVSQDLSLYASFFSLTTVTGTSRTSQTLKSYEVTLNVRPHNVLQQAYISSINGTLMDTAFGSPSLTVKTMQPFVRLSNQPYADQGEILIMDSTRARVRAKVISPTTVAIELDEDGDGRYETGVNKLWREML